MNAVRNAIDRLHLGTGTSAKYEEGNEPTVSIGDARYKILGVGEKGRSFVVTLEAIYDEQVKLEVEYYRNTQYWPDRIYVTTTINDYRSTTVTHSYSNGLGSSDLAHKAGDWFNTNVSQRLGGDHYDRRNASEFNDRAEEILQILDAINVRGLP